MIRKAVLLFCLISLTGCAHAWDRTDKAFLIASIAACAFDAGTTLNMLDNPHNHEINPLMGRHPSTGRVLITMGLTQLAVVIVADYLPSDWRKALLGAKAGLNTTLAIHNTRLEQ